MNPKQVLLLGGAFCACTWHFFYNSKALEELVALQAALTVSGNATMCFAAFCIYKLSEGSSNCPPNLFLSLFGVILFAAGTSEDVVELFPEKGLLPSTLKYLGIGNLPNLKSMNKSGLQLLGFLEYMEIENCPQLKSLPEEGLPTSLLGLRIVDNPLLEPHCRREEGEDWHKISHVSAICIDGEGIFDQIYLSPVDPLFWYHYSLYEHKFFLDILQRRD
ncbi:hypothetical protein Vadar_012650 [Vaccinium darrowii]|uniref:Uncharacterized protein n=1 Tax=Vaccinium darrowii TaxID=229202 RepID=A0ACB7ZBD1_9ERIC|nr:hypothetical protein Vadar_012650 [Vaccinium darrowii]